MSVIQTITFAATETGSDTGLFGALGIDWRILIVQIIAFLVFVWLVGKFIFPFLIKFIDKREAAIAASIAAANEAEANAEKTQADIEKLLKTARADAAAVLDTAQKEAAQMVKDAEEKAKKRGEQIIADSRAQLDVDIRKAREALRKETTELVALATEKIIREKVDTKKDAQLIEAALKEAA